MEKFKIKDSIRKVLPDWLKVATDKMGEILEAEDGVVYDHFLKAMGITSGVDKCTFAELQTARWMFFHWVNSEVVKKFGGPDHQTRCRVLVKDRKTLPKQKKGDKALKDPIEIYEEIKKADKLPKIKKG